MKKSFFILTTLLLFLVCGCSKPLSKNGDFAFGTFIEVTSDDPRAASIVFEVFRRLEKIFSLYDSESELSQLNEKGSLVASVELFEALMKAQEMHQKTQGAFDSTVGPLSLLWKKAIHDRVVPEDGEVKKALDEVGFDFVYLDPSTRVVRLLRRGAKIDLGGLAKGYAVDQAVEQLIKAGIQRALVNAGGDIYGLARNGSRQWRVGIQDPKDAFKFRGRVSIKNRAIATSGDYEQFVKIAERTYSHIVDPKTGYPSDTGIVAATVFAPECLTADVLATTALVLGQERFKQILPSFPGVNARLFDSKGQAYEL